ncbi:hypothetical protein MT356_20760 [Rathayibacter festucae]|uniref:hypothetical protein n=1 Tax=Rathayibacter festucae TaxID=110937 RepID=UPI001FB2756A|nr:hypothetical protein [Rathayibacter festucae]MCJ1702150.1 hypothetical protein [Rathayibacter festucae]
MKKTRAIWATALVLGMGASLLVTQPAAAEPLAAATKTPEVTRVVIPFSGGVELSSAVKIARSAGINPVAFRFESDQVVGEYSTVGGDPVNDFLAKFTDRFGTVPRVVGAVIETPKPSTTERRAIGTPPPLATNLPDFIPPAVLAEKAAKLTTGSAPAPRDASVASTQAVAAAAAAEWRPQNVRVTVQRSGTSQFITNQINWGAGSPRNIPGPWGVEVGTDLYNDAVGVRGSIVPGQVCGPNFRDQFIAKNYSFKSWTTFNPEGSMAATHPYADYNDLFDDCKRNAMTIGFQDPQKMVGKELTTQIEARLGVTSSSRLGGELQLVNGSSCPSDGSIALTDCMGIPVTNPPGVPKERLTLSKTKNWVANPNKCWFSGGYGDISAVASTCIP